jgi:uncharacterized protein YjcR
MNISYAAVVKIAKLTDRHSVYNWMNNEERYIMGQYTKQ